MARGRKFEGSPADMREDRAGAKRRGMTLKQYERSAADKREDKRGQAKLDQKRRR
jgi:hypothetical protein